MSRQKLKRVGRNQLIREVTDDLGISPDDREATTQIQRGIISFLNRLTDHLENGDSVSLSRDGLGRFDVVSTKAREGRNIVTGERIPIPEGLRVKFIPVTGLRTRLKSKGKRE